MANLALESDLTGNGVTQGDLVKVIQNIIAALAEVQTTTANFKSIYDNHVHTADGNAARTSKPDTGTAVGSPSAASAFTNTATTAPVLTKG